MGKNKYHTTWHNDNINTARSKNMKSRKNKTNPFAAKPDNQLIRKPAKPKEENKK